MVFEELYSMQSVNITIAVVAVDSIVVAEFVISALQCCRRGTSDWKLRSLAAGQKISLFHDPVISSPVTFWATFCRKFCDLYVSIYDNWHEITTGLLLRSILVTGGRWLGLCGRKFVHQRHNGTLLTCANISAVGCCTVDARLTCYLALAGHTSANFTATTRHRTSSTVSAKQYNQTVTQTYRTVFLTLNHKLSITRKMSVEKQIYYVVLIAKHSGIDANTWLFSRNSCRKKCCQHFNISGNIFVTYNQWIYYQSIVLHYWNWI